MPESTAINPLARLLATLPAEVARTKKKAIKAELLAIRKWGHYEQSVLRPGWKFGDTHISVASVLMQQLGLSLAFFTASAEQQQAEIERILSTYYP